MDQIIVQITENKRNEISHQNHTMILTAKNICGFQSFIINNAITITLILNISKCIRQIKLYIYS